MVEEPRILGRMFEVVPAKVKKGVSFVDWGLEQGEGLAAVTIV